MNPLTLVKRIQNINSREAALGISEDASWHAKYKGSAYVFVGGIPFNLTEGDILAVFAQYGEIVDVNLVRDKGTGKSKGFAFIAYEDQRSTNLAVDNLNGAQVLGRVIRVDHVTAYKKKEEQDEEAEQQKREARGVCRAFQKGECNRGAGCKFSHDEQRAANTGWGAEDKSSSWGHDKFDGPTRTEKRSSTRGHVPELKVERGFRMKNKDARHSQAKGFDRGMDIGDHHWRDDERNKVDCNIRDLEEQPKSWEKERDHREDREKSGTEKRSRRHDTEPNSRDEYDRKEEKKRLRRHESESSPRDDRAGGRRRHDTEPNSRDEYDRKEEKKRPRRHESESSPRDDRAGERRRHDTEPNSRDEYDRKEEKKRPRGHESESSPRDDRAGERGKRLSHHRDSSLQRHKRDEDQHGRDEDKRRHRGR